MFSRPMCINVEGESAASRWFVDPKEIIRVGDTGYMKFSSTNRGAFQLIKKKCECAVPKNANLSWSVGLRELRTMRNEKQSELLIDEIKEQEANDEKWQKMKSFFGEADMPDAGAPAEKKPRQSRMHIKHARCNPDALEISVPLTTAEGVATFFPVKMLRVPKSDECLAIELKEEYMAATIEYIRSRDWLEECSGKVKRQVREELPKGWSYVRNNGELKGYVYTSGGRRLYTRDRGKVVDNPSLPELQTACPFVGESGIDGVEHHEGDIDGVEHHEGDVDVEPKHQEALAQSANAGD